ncbi:MAG: xanthine dehydrogenase family protein subunit M [Alphaproteobacteria bacterium]|nr:xanthine dehydrogenase family protein subunit M [Alphaproteobacteria bacterium]
MTPFELVEPRSLREAAALLDADDPSVRPIAGGTALMLMMKAGVFKPTRLVSLRSVESDASRIQADDNVLRIGALAPLSTIERSADVRRLLPGVTQTLRTLSNVRVRNVATIGGHLAHADPHMDLPPLLIALGAKIGVVGPVGERTLPIEELFAGYFETSLVRNELIAELSIPLHPQRRAVYLKCTTRSTDDWPALGVAVALETAGATIKEAHVVVSAATERPTKLSAAGAVLLGGRGDDAALRRAGDAAADEITPMADAHGSAAYKRELVRVYVGRAVRAALAAGGAA